MLVRPHQIRVSACGPFLPCKKLLRTYFFRGPASIARVFRMRRSELQDVLKPRVGAHPPVGLSGYDEKGMLL